MLMQAKIIFRNRGTTEAKSKSLDNNPLARALFGSKEFCPRARFRNLRNEAYFYRR